MDVVMPFIAACRPVHHPQHLEAAGCDEPPYQNSSEEKKPDIKPYRVVPRNRCFDDAGLRAACAVDLLIQQSYIFCS
jgi:hypothetical protein